jgi:hypothetical protein
LWSKPHNLIGTYAQAHATIRVYIAQVNYIGTG